MLEQTLPFKVDRVMISAVGLQIRGLTLCACSHDDIEEIGIS